MLIKCIYIVNQTITNYKQFVRKIVGKEMSNLIKLYSLLGILISVWTWTLIQSFYALFKYPKLNFVISLSVILFINFINSYEKVMCLVN